LVFVIGALAFGHVRADEARRSVASRGSARRGRRADGLCARNGGTGPFRYVAEECVAIVGAAIVSF